MLHAITLLIITLLPIDPHDFASQACIGGETEQPDGNQLSPPEDVPRDQTFCCTSVNAEGKGSGEDCSAISKELINSCTNVLYCSGSWAKIDGVITCL